MARFVHIPESTNLAFHALATLGKTTGTLTNINEIAKTLGVSEAHLSKVLQAMRKAGFVSAIRGPSGGYALAKTPSEISLLEIHEALHGSTDASACLLKAPVCPHKCCILGKFAKKLDDDFKLFLFSTTLGAFMTSSQ